MFCKISYILSSFPQFCFEAQGSRALNSAPVYIYIYIYVFFAAAEM
jgi:hypothetical protein